MGLAPWQLYFGAEYPENANAWLSIEATPGKYEAVIRIGEGFWELSREATREAVIHELAHLHQLRLWHMVRDLDGHLSDPAHTMFMTEYKREMEYANDRLTRAFEHRLPLPPEWP